MALCESCHHRIEAVTDQVLSSIQIAVTLDGSSDLSGDLKTNLGSLDVCVPAELGVRITSRDSLSSSDFGGAGLTLVNGAWQTPNFDTATHKANISVETSLGSLKLHSAGGCK